MSELKIYEAKTERTASRNRQTPNYVRNFNNLLSITDNYAENQQG